MRSNLPPKLSTVSTGVHPSRRAHSLALASAFLLALASIPALSQALEKLLTDPALARSWGAASRVSVEKKFATSTTTAQLKRLLTRHAPVWPPLAAIRLDPPLLSDAIKRFTAR